MAIEMSDYIVLVDTPNGEARASAVIAKAKEFIPDKPIRYVVAMHHHSDHLGGIRTAIDEGTTILTHETNKALAEADAYTPPETPVTPLIAPKVPYAAALCDNVQRLQLDVRTIVPFHGARTVDMAEVTRQAGR